MSFFPLPIPHQALRHTLVRRGPLVGYAPAGSSLVEYGGAGSDIFINGGTGPAGPPGPPGPPGPSGLSNYGFITSSTDQLNPVAGAINIVTFDAVSPASDVSLAGGGTEIVVVNAGVYTKLFTIIVSKTSGGTSGVTIWLRYNGVDLPGSAHPLQLINTLSQIFVTGNYTLIMAAGSNIQMCWTSNDTTISLAVLPAGTAPVSPSGYSAKVTLTRIS
jgi:hypothetical protein